ncbi:MAG: hypothetical protein JNG86_20680, partial [Verrucomicrobiaceae bacterium]|nr:hypothetical protein [Verrucomicrobiaceae bacterium]
EEAQKHHAAHSNAVAGLQTERQHQEQALTAVEERLTAAQEALKACQDEHAAEKRQLDDTRALRASLEAANNAPLDDLRQRIDKARHDLGILEARLMPLRDWKEAQDKRLAHFSALPADSPEARELLREIDAEAADLLRIIHTPPSRTPRIIQVEPPLFKGVPLKSEHTRVRKGGE